MFCFLWLNTRVGIAGSYGTSIFWGNSIVFHSACMNLHFHQQCTCASFSLPPCQHVIFLIFFITALLTGMKSELIVVLICISLIINDVEHIFIYLSVICMSSLEKMAIYIFCPFLNQIVYFLWLSCLSSLYILHICPLSDIWFASTDIFFSFSRLHFHFMDGLLCCIKSF